MTISEATEKCRSIGLSGWELVEYAQRLVAGHMRYSYFNSFDMPGKAFARGRGYCWQQAGTLNKILLGLGVSSRLVYASKCSFPDTLREGVPVHIGESGHVWCRIKINGVEEDCCPGNTANSPGHLHFQPLSTVKEFRGPVVFFSYLGSVFVNQKRGKKFLEAKAKQESLHNPEKCPCKKKKCPRFAKCEECISNHKEKGSLPYCER